MASWLKELFGSNDDKTNALIFDVDKGDYGMEYITPDSLSSPVRRRLYCGKRVMLFVRRNGTLWGFDYFYMPKELGKSIDKDSKGKPKTINSFTTKDVYYALPPLLPLRKIMEMPMSLREKIGYGILIAFGAIGFFVCYLMVDMAGKGGG